MESKPTPGLLYKETVRAPLWLVAFLLFLTESVALSIWAAFDNQTGLIAFVIAGAVVAIGASSMSLRISVTETELRVGRAHIERKYLGSVTVLEKSQMALVRGRDADPAAYLALRFWQPRGIKILLEDQRDPTPYWLVTTKKPTQLAAALQNAD